MNWPAIGALALPAVGPALAAWKKPGEPKPFQPSEYSESVWAQLQDMLGGNRIQRTMERSGARALGRSQTQGIRAATRNLSGDPQLLAAALQKLQETTARAGTDISERGVLAQEGQRERAVGQMGTMGARRDAMEYQAQRDREIYEADLWAGVLEGLGAAGAGYAEQEGLKEAVQMLMSGGAGGVGAAKPVTRRYPLPEDSGYPRSSSSF